MDREMSFEEKKQTVLAAAAKEGIVDIVTGSKEEGISLKTVELATRLMRDHGEAAYGRLEAHLREQT